MAADPIRGNGEPNPALEDRRLADADTLPHLMPRTLRLPLLLPQRHRAAAAARAAAGRAWPLAFVTCTANPPLNPTIAIEGLAYSTSLCAAWGVQQDVGATL